MQQEKLSAVNRDSFFLNNYSSVTFEAAGELSTESAAEHKPEKTSEILTYHF